jgi:hypothetical protein
MGIDAFELGKHSLMSNISGWLKDTPIVSYGVVTEVLAQSIVKVELVVRDGASRRFCIVPLLSSVSSLFEAFVAPQKGDLVLLLFLDKYTPRMFSDPLSRFEAANDWSIYDPMPPGYSLGSGVGILLAPYKGLAETTLHMHRSDGSPVMTLHSAAHLSAVLQREVSLIFDALPGDDDVKDRLVQAAFGQHSPVLITHWAAVVREYGFSVLGTGEKEELAAPVTERYSIYAPITRDIQGAQITDVGLGTDKDGKSVETDAPTTEIVHGKATVVRDIRSPQSLTVGIGNAESEDEEEERDAPVSETYGSKSPITKDIRGPQTYTVGIGKDGDTEAPVDITMGEKADVALTSKSGLAAEFKKAVDLSSEDAIRLASKKAFDLLSDDVMSVIAKKAVTLKSDSSELVETGNAVATLGALMGEFLDIMIAFDTAGSPAAHTTGPAALPKLQALKQKFSKVFK